MIQVPINRSHIEVAQAKSTEMGVLKNSVTEGDGNIAGFVGELLVAEHIGGEVCNTYDYDVLLDGVRIDVKTKRAKFQPYPHFDCSIMGFNTSQDCDYYYFARIKTDFTIAWLLGAYPKELYFKDAILHKAGSVDKSNNFTFKADCYNLAIHKLKQLTKEKNGTDDYWCIHK